MGTEEDLRVSSAVQMWSNLFPTVQRPDHRDHLVLGFRLTGPSVNRKGTQSRMGSLHPGRPACSLPLPMMGCHCVPGCFTAPPFPHPKMGTTEHG